MTSTRTVVTVCATPTTHMRSTCIRGNNVTGDRVFCFTRGFAVDATESPADASENTSDDTSETTRRLKLRDDKDTTRQLTARLLQGAMKHVSQYGWSKDALRQAAFDLNLSPAVIGQLPNAAGALVHHFCNECDSRLSVKLVLELDDEQLTKSTPSERLATVIKWRLDMIKPLIDHWPAAIAVQAAPENIASMTTRVALLSDELVGAMGAWGVGLSRATRAIVSPEPEAIPPEDEEDDLGHRNALGNDSSEKVSSKENGDVPSNAFNSAVLSGAGWYADRAAVAALYGACELFMTTDTSPGFSGTNKFVDTRCAELAAFATTAEELATQVNAAVKGFKPKGNMPFPPLPHGTKDVESLFSKVIDTVMGIAAKAGRR